MAEKSFGVKEINLIGASGTPTIESPNNINLTAVNVAMSNNASVAGNLSVTGTLAGNGSNLTNLSAANLTGTLPAISGANLTNLPATSPTTSDIQVAYELLSTSSTSNGYRISGNGVDSSTANPDLYLVRGQKYRFINNSGGIHPFRIQSDNGSTLYSTGVTNNNASTGNIDFAPPHSAPQQLYYKCGNHPSMLGNIYIVGSFSKISVSGQSDIVVDNLSSTMTFVAGSNMTITTNAASNAVTFAASGGGGGGALEFVSKTEITVSNATTQIDFTGLDQGFVYKLVCAVANMSGYGEQRVYLYLNGSSSINTSNIIDYVGTDPGSNQRWTDANNYIRVYTYGYEQYNWEYTMDFYTGTYGWFRGTGHPNGGANYQAGWGNFWGHLDPSNFANKYISGISCQQGGGYFQNGSKFILYKYKES